MMAPEDETIWDKKPGQIGKKQTVFSMSGRSSIIKHA
jgi:hypothetical protein